MMGTVDKFKIKNDMMELWKEVFHDSYSYIKLVFDSYFIPDNAFTVYDGEKLVASLLGVEYTFQIIDNNGQKKYLKGLYLCGLATHPDYRRQGIMTNLMNKAECSAKARGFALTFLIPADANLRRYYERKGYRTASYKWHMPLKRSLSYPQDKMNIYTFRNLLENGKIEFIRQIAQWCIDRERYSNYPYSILHSIEDMMTIISENENSFFITNDSFDLEYPILTGIKAVVFPTSSEDEKCKIWYLTGLFLEKEEEVGTSGTRDLILPDYIRFVLQQVYPNHDFILNIPFTGEELVTADIDPYAMIKPIEIGDNFLILENQTFKIYLMLD